MRNILFALTAIASLTTAGGGGGAPPARPWGGGGGPPHRTHRSEAGQG